MSFFKVYFDWSAEHVVNKLDQSVEWSYFNASGLDGWKMGVADQVGPITLVNCVNSTLPTRVSALPASRSHRLS
jgi:hypothetical protein